MLGKVFYYAFLVCQLVHFEYLDLLESRGSGSALTAVEMPSAWEHRYVRVSASAGQQCALLRKSAQNGIWLAYFPDDQIRGIKLQDKRTVQTSVKAGVAYTPLPILSDGQKQAIQSRAAALAVPSARFQLVEMLNPDHPGAALRRMVTALACTPMTSAKWIRWSLRSPTRVAGGLALMFLIYEALSHVGLFQKVNSGIDRLVEVYATFKENLQEFSDTMFDQLNQIEEFYKFIHSYIAPWRLLAYALSVGAMLYAWVCITSEDEEEPPTPTSSVGNSPEGTPLSSPRAYPAEDLLSRFTDAVSSQSAMLESLVSQQAALREQFLDDQSERKAAGLARTFRAVS